MRNLKRKSALAAATACVLIATIGVAEAAGAFAVGACGAFGYGYDFHKADDARIAAMKKCTGHDCRVIGVMRRGCAAMSIDAKNPCGPYGWALNPHLGRAENAAMKRCSQFGGHQCVLRAWACDEKG